MTKSPILETSSSTPLSQSLFATGGFASERPPRRTPQNEPGSGLRAPSPLGKNFILDTNVLIHDPLCLERFADNHVCIPMDVLCELDRFKDEQSDRGASARVVHRSLTRAFEKNPQATTVGVPTLGGGTLRLVVHDPGLSSARLRLNRFRRILPEPDRVDNRILACALLVTAENPSAQTVLVTKDLNMQLKARALGLDCEDYENDKITPQELDQPTFPVLEVEPNDLQRFASTGRLELAEVPGAPLLHPNDYVLLQAGDKRTMPARFVENGFIRLNVPDALRNPKGHRLKPVNLGQLCLIDALLDPTITLVTCFGAAGTGKTLVGVAAGLHAVYERSYQGLTVSRPVVPMGDSVGFLPGDLSEKMRPWLQPIYDALDYLMPPGGRGKKSNGQNGEKETTPLPISPGAKRPYEELLDAGIVEIEALCYIRGRSIPNRFFILDEAQQMTPREAKAVVTRMSKGSKLLMIGDPAQIDNPYVDSLSNGLVYTRRRLQDLPITAHISLTKGERSDLAEAGAKLM